MHVAVLNRQRSLPICVEQVVDLVKEVVSFEGRSYLEVAIHFIGAAAMRKLHARFFQDPRLTDCISFPIDLEAKELLGDVFVCPKAAMVYVQQERGDPYREMTLYVVHGLLHLMGYDDITDEACKEMRLAEERHMSHLQKRRLVLAAPKEVICI